MRRARGPLAAAALALALAGCGGSSGSADPTGGGPTDVSPATSGPSTAPDSDGSEATVDYVALGDSYVAAPGLPPSADDDARCDRSAHDYPHLIAAENPRIRLDDVSCTGATSSDVVGDQSGALSAGTDLVTVTIGGNDDGLFITLVGGCTQLAQNDRSGHPCADVGASRADAALGDIATNVDQVLTTIEEKAPNATVVVVGYPLPLPSRGSCPSRVEIAPGDYSFVNSVVRRLSGALETAAREHGAQFVDVATASRGHDICSTHPWVNGQTTAANGVIPFHPFLAEQRAIARLVPRVQ